MASFTFNGLNSETDFNLRIHDVVYNVLPQTVDHDIKVPYGRGRYDYGTYLDANTIGFVCSLQGASYSDVFTQVEELGVWLNPETGVKKLEYSGKPDRYCYAKITGDTNVKQILKYGKFTLTFKIPEGIWYGDEVTWLSTDVDDLLNSGGLSADGIITITCDAITAFLEIAITGTSELIRIEDSFIVNDVISINLKTGSVTKNGTSILNRVTLASTLFDGTFVIPQGDSRLTISGASVLSITFEEKWL